jgi:prepilin-type N-terminal cleavage/methylation domain-containing protein
MNSTLKKFAQAGFTLVELLIVVVILAILAAIVIPQFSISTVDAKESALDVNLSALRSAIELYKLQHGVYPGAASAVATTTCTAGTGTGIATGGTGVTASQAFIEQLTMYSNAAGGTCPVNEGSNYKFGPYMRKMPNDPIGGTVGSLAAGIVTTGVGTGIAAPAAATGGWAYDTKSGQILMNSNAQDVNTKAYSTH